jgi:PAS domain S-box-containing protein
MENRVDLRGFRRLISTIKTYLDSFTQSSESLEQARRVYLLILISAIGIINLIPLGIVALLEGDLTLGIADLSLAFILFFNLWHAKQKNRFTLNIYIGLTFTALLFVYLFMSGGLKNTGFMWYFTFPLIALYLLGSRKGATVSALMLLPVILQNIVPIPQGFFTKYPAEFYLRFIMAYIVVLLFSYMFESTREKNRDELSEIQNNLEERVSSRTREISDVNKQLKLEIKRRVRIEESLRESEEKYRLITDSTTDLIAITTFSIKPIYTFVSPSHKQVMGYEPDDLIGKSGFSLIHPEDRRKLLPLSKQYFKSKVKLLANSKSLQFGEIIEYRIKDKTGNYHHMESKVNLIGDKLLFVSRDITDRKRAETEKSELEEKLHRSEKMETLGHLAGGVAHDLNNVLGAIIGYPDIMLKKLEENSPLINPIITMKKSGQKAVAIVQDLLALTRRGVLIKELVNLNQIVDDHILSPELEKLLSFHPNVQITTRLDPKLLRLKGSPIHLSKMLMNLVSNAAESMPSGGTVNITTANIYLDQSVKAYEGSIPEGDYVVLKVIDAGVGIPTKALKKIFEPFYTKKTMGRSGTGLGMAVVWGTVVDHNGNIIINTRRNKGTTMELFFPATREKLVHVKKKRESTDYQGKREKILVVDDIKDQREIVSFLLTNLGYTVDTVSSGEEAINYIKKGTPDLILLDMIMDPGIDGLETFKRIIKIKPGMKVIIASGYSETRRVREALRLGAGKYIKKPFTMKKLGIEIRTMLDK